VLWDARYIQGGRKVLHQNIFTGRVGCREQCEIGYLCPEMNSNDPIGGTRTFLRKLGNAGTQAIWRHNFCISCERQFRIGLLSPCCSVGKHVALRP